MDAEKAITRAKVGLILDQPWFGTLITKLIVDNGTDRGVDTMATDGTYLYYSPKFVDSITPQELTAVLAHEVMHCAFLHPFRRESREPKQWNWACDLAINEQLVKSGFTLPQGCLLPSKFGLPDGLHAEKYYAMLEQQKQSGKPQPQDGNGKNGIGGVMDAPKPGSGKPDQSQSQSGNGKGQTPTPGNGSQSDIQPRTESDWVIDTIQAEKVASAAGKMPGGLASELRKTRETKTNYREVLRRFIDRTIACDYSWATPNRRMLGSGMVLPGVHRENLGELVIAVDTSGSVYSEMLDQFAADIETILQTQRPSKVHVLYCDTRVFKTAEFEPDNPFTFERNVARGGTYFQPVFDWVTENQIEPRALLYLTDLEPGDHPQDPGYPVLWCVPETCSTKTWDWGEVVEVTMDQGGRV